jgi:Fe-S cluster biogenesis protein NfuA
VTATPVRPEQGDARAAATGDLAEVGERIERLLDELATRPDARARDVAEELVRCVTDLYGEGLARVMAALHERDPELACHVASDEVVGSLLLVHDLHPHDVTTRVEAALDSVRPILAAHGGDVTIVGVDATSATVTVALEGSCDGCPSSTATLRGAVERAVLAAAPEVARVEVAPPRPLAEPVVLGVKRSFEQCPAELPTA